MATRPPIFLFELYDEKDRPLLPTRLERVYPSLVDAPRPLLPVRLEQVHPIEIKAPRPVLPPESFQTVIHSNWALAGDASTYMNTQEEEVEALKPILNNIRVHSPDAFWISPEERHATDGLSQLWSSEPGTPPHSPPRRVFQSPYFREASSTPSTSSWMDCLGSPVDSAPESPVIHSCAETGVCINIEACVLEVRRMGWRQKWAHTRQQVRRRVQAQETLRRDRLIGAITPDRLGARSPFVEAQPWDPSTAVPSRRWLADVKKGSLWGVLMNPREGYIMNGMYLTWA
ncbi:hypothetical protein B0H21DRAFT_824456 [Amylocystis lapponica]|nr:hypothetical protein B0H21DRAFT_824456 [Amylocystis lapponica]